ncbi:MAG: phosphoenolpyruvate synthase [Leptotrichiaceae bacterium]|nr:phosphoenolpyruvate synthase [Leptotrichiaceae bacterium]MBP7739499.1 phosphoenolpyruvate synthase [Leptotrichiaceae bacterium]
MNEEYVLFNEKSKINEENEHKIRLQIGGKALNLIKLSNNNFNVPSFFAIPIELLKENSNGNQSENYKKLLQIEITRLKDKGYKYFSVRSSAVSEDGSKQSFAGQYDSFLYVLEDTIYEYIDKVLDSANSKRISTYKNINNDISYSNESNELSYDAYLPSVIVQGMVDSEISGIAFSNDPINISDDIIINATYGLGSSIVNGEVDGDTFKVSDKFKIKDKKIANKHIKHVLSETKNSIDIVGVNEEDAEKQCIDDSNIIRLSKIIKDIENYYDVPQDIEWAYSDGQIYILQSRPITTINKHFNNSTIWDNSNIVESYSGITLPLTFSFIKKAYSNVYEEFSKIMNVDQKAIIENRLVFNSMIGYIHGRVYYNLINWYKLILLFPGFNSNKQFMEQMMGVKEELDMSELNIENKSKFETMVSKMKLLKVGVTFFKNFIFFNIKKKAFLNIVKKYIDDDYYSIDNEKNVKQLYEKYNKIENEVLYKWNLPIINDFFTMIFFGLLKKIIKKWKLDDSEEGLHNELLSQEEQLFSAEPYQYISKMNNILKNDKNLQEYLSNNEYSSEIQKEIQKNTEFKSIYDEYMNKFGDRGICELKLESSTIRENPNMLYKSILDMKHTNRENKNEDILARRKKIEKIVLKKMNGNLFKQIMFKFILKYARKHLSTREFLRYERTKAFAKVRKIFKTISINFCESKIIDNTNDIYYLEMSEIFGIVNGTTTTKNLKELINIRKNEIEKYKNINLPDRFKTIGAIGENVKIHSLDKKIELSTNEKSGIGCCTGIVRGRIQVVINPSEKEVKKDSIVVTKSTDPGWVMVFPLMKGLIVEKGSLLSHSAIISREIGLPTVVSVECATLWLNDGDYVELDGATGIIRKIEEGEYE